MTEASPPERPRRVRQLVVTVGFMLGGICLWLVLASVLEIFARQRGIVILTPDRTATLAALAIQAIAGLLALIPLTWIAGVFALGMDGTALTWLPLRRAGGGFPLGLLLGLLAAVVAVGLSLPLGGARFLPDTGGVGEYLERVGLLLVLLAPAALAEELLCRGVAQMALGQAIGRVPGVLVLSTVFALMHAGNPNSTPLGLVNVGLAGVMLGLLVYSPGGIWTAWGAHLGWNGALAAMDASVSGLAIQVPLINYNPGGPSWLTGGSFGPEGGLLATGAIGLGIVAAWRWTRKEYAA